MPSGLFTNIIFPSRGGRKICENRQTKRTPHDDIFPTYLNPRRLQLSRLGVNIIHRVRQVSETSTPRRERLRIPIMRDLHLGRPRGARHEHQRKPSTLRVLSPRLLESNGAKKRHRRLQIAASNHRVQIRHVSILGKRVIRIHRQVRAHRTLRGRHDARARTRDDVTRARERDAHQRMRHTLSHVVWIIAHVVAMRAIRDATRARGATDVIARAHVARRVARER